MNIFIKIWQANGFNSELKLKNKLWIQSCVAQIQGHQPLHWQYMFWWLESKIINWFIQERNKTASTTNLKNFLPFHSAMSIYYSNAWAAPNERWRSFSRILFTVVCHAPCPLMTFHTETWNRPTFVICHGAIALNLNTKPQHNQMCKKLLWKT